MPTPVEEAADEGKSVFDSSPIITASATNQEAYESL